MDDKIEKKSIDEILGKKKKPQVDLSKAKAFLEKIKSKKTIEPKDDSKNTVIADSKQEPLTEPKNIQAMKTKKHDDKDIKVKKEEIQTKESVSKNISDVKKETSKTVEKKHVEDSFKPIKNDSFPPTENGFVTYEIKDLHKSKTVAKKKEVKETKPPTSSKTKEKSQDTKKEEQKSEKTIKIERKEGVEYKKLRISSTPTVRELAEKLGISPVELIKKLMSYGVFASITQKLDEDVAAFISLEYGYELEFVPVFEDSIIVDEEEKDDPSKLKPRPPIITIMGHVDHGKTTLLDALRQSNVVDTEAGQITQHIGAYMVRTPKGNITVIDTPGHEAFTAMRAQGAKITDIVVLVVSAVDGVMPQTIEAINHAKAANVPIIVAINKIDLPEANPQMIKQQLSNYELIPEEWGGKTPMVEISAKRKINIDKLLDIILLQAEIMEIKANYDAKGSAVVIEARKDSKKGVVATVICNRGRIRVGDPFVVGTDFGKVRALVDDLGNKLKELLPGFPAELLGINEDIPVPGDILRVVDSDKLAREIAEKRKQIRKDNILHQKNISLVSLKSQIEQKLIKKLNVIIKTDVYGSLQAIRDSLEKFSNPEVAIHILHTGIGDITESDVLLAKASNAIIFGFNVKASDDIKEKAKNLGVDIKIYRIIYELFDELKAAIEGMIEPEVVEVVVGRALVKQIFDLSVGRVCGCIVNEGKITRNSMVRIKRGDEVVGEGKVVGLKRFKEDVKEVEKGYECGIMIDGFKNFEIGDIIEAYTKEERIRRISDLQG